MIKWEKHGKIRSRFIQNEILILLSDKKVHTAQEIADALEISARTVYRHISDMSSVYPITTGCSISFRGIRLLYNSSQNDFFTEWEINYLFRNSKSAYLFCRNDRFFMSLRQLTLPI